LVISGTPGDDLQAQVLHWAAAGES